MKKHVVTAITIALTFFAATSLQAADAEARTFDAFLGQWDNTDPNTRGITRVEVFKKDGKMRVRAWGRCHPTECYWGESEANSIIDGEPFLHVLWMESFKDETQKITIAPSGELKVESSCHFTDDSGRKDRTGYYTFQKGWSQNWSDEKN